MNQLIINVNKWYNFLFFHSINFIQCSLAVIIKILQLLLLLMMMMMQLSWLYPDSAASINIHAPNTSQQIVSVRARSVRARIEAVAEIFMQAPRSRDHILTVNLVSWLN